MDIKIGSVVLAIMALFLIKIGMENDFFKGDKSKSNSTRHRAHMPPTPRAV